jgi:photosystem II stability/assembly factor-like uncharacterized protein
MKLTRAVLFFLMILALDTYGQMISDSTKVYGMLSYRNIGPFRGGRSCAVVGVDSKPNTFYFGATGGGVWKSEDGGRAWKNISDGYFGGSIGTITIAPSDENVIYVGGGEKTVRGNVSYGYGIWKSEDAGKTWKDVGLKNSRHIGRIRVHPDNPDIVYAAVMGDLFKPTQDRGVYKSIDGGKNWKKVLFANEQAGAVDLVIDPNNHRIIFASTWRIKRTPYDLSSGGDGSALCKSTDGGETWTNISGNEGLPKGAWGIVGIAVAFGNSDKIFALIENENGGLYRSADGGKSWTKVNDDRNLRQRAWYYTRIYTDTKDENTVYVLNVDYHKSVDGGKTFTASEAPHGDHHDLWIAPSDPKRMIMGDDGGAQVSYDGGETWSTYHNQPTAQFYRIATDNDFPFKIYAAQQDNSTVRIAHRTFGASITEDDWEDTAGGESAHIAVDPKNNDIVYGGSYGGFLTRVNHDKNTTKAINVWPDNPMGYGAEGMKYRFQWNFPIFFSRHDPKKLYTCSQHLHLSTDEGHSWSIVSPDLSRNEKEKLVSSGGPITKDNTGVEYYATIFAADESPKKEGVIWAGTDDGRLHVTLDGGKTWTETTDAKLMPKYIMWNSVEPSNHDVGTCYVAGTSYKSGDYAPYIFKTTDFGKTWTKITTGINGEHFTRVVREDPIKKGLLYAGTETGMYISFDDGMNWQSFQLNLPIVPITDLKIKENHLIVGTQGRSIWMIDDLTVLHQLDGNTTANKLFKPKNAYRVPGFQSQNTTLNGKNHASGIVVNYFLPKFEDKKDTIVLIFKSSTGDTVRTFSTISKEPATTLKPKKGPNTFSWDGRYPNAKNFDGMILWWSSLQGPQIIPGTYSVELTHNGAKQSQNVSFLQNPNSEASAADVKEQFDFIKSVNDKVTQAHQAIIDIRSVKKSFDTYGGDLKDGDLKKMHSEIDSISSAIEKELYQTKNRSGQDPLNFPIKLTNKLAHLNGLAQMGGNDSKPTASMYAVRDELVKAINDQLDKWSKIKTDMVPKLNEMMRSKTVDYIKIPK